MVSDEGQVFVLNQDLTYGHTNALTLRQIRSHAQTYVQRRRKAKNGLPEGKRAGQTKGTRIVVRELVPPSKSTADSPPKQQEQQQYVASEASPWIFKSAEETQALKDLATRAQPSPSKLSAFEPFGVFPVTIDSSFVGLFERYYRGYKWELSKQELLAQTACDSLLCRSFLAIACNVYHPGEMATLQHETDTIQAVSRELTSIRGGTSKPGSTDVSLTWAISRLAMIRAQQGDWETALRHVTASITTCGPITTLSSHKFGSHLQCTFMVLLLSNFTLTRKTVPDVPQIPSLWSPFGNPPQSVLSQVEALGFKLPLASLLSIRNQGIHPQLDDILCALSALCFPASSAMDVQATHAVIQAIWMLRLGLWLAELSPLSHDFGDTARPEWHEQLQECLRLAASMFMLSPSPAARDVSNQLREKLTPELLRTAIGRSGGTKSTQSALPFWILLVCGATGHVAEDQIYFARLILKFYPGFLDHAMTGPTAPFSRLPGKFISPTLDCSVTGVNYLNSAKGWLPLWQEAQQRSRPSGQIDMTSDTISSQFLGENESLTTLSTGESACDTFETWRWRLPALGMGVVSPAAHYLLDPDYTAPSWPEKNSTSNVKLSIGEGLGIMQAKRAFQSDRLTSTTQLSIGKGLGNLQAHHALQSHRRNHELSPESEYFSIEDEFLSF